MILGNMEVGEAEGRVEKAGRSRFCRRSTQEFSNHVWSQTLEEAIRRR